MKKEAENLVTLSLLRMAGRWRERGGVGEWAWGGGGPASPNKRPRKPTPFICITALSGQGQITPICNSSLSAHFILSSSCPSPLYQPLPNLVLHDFLRYILVFPLPSIVYPPIVIPFSPFYLYYLIFSPFFCSSSYSSLLNYSSSR
jgi:hypothetical protein